MSFDTNWDIEKYKSPFECDDHWQLRKNFLVAHKRKYPEDQLVCLAQVFFNVELLGCKYPDETMQLVSNLSEGIADSYREKKRQKLQRTFVKASDAAGARIKGRSSTNVLITSPTQNSAVNFNHKESIDHQTVVQNTSIEDQTTPDLQNTDIQNRTNIPGRPIDLRSIKFDSPNQTSILGPPSSSPNIQTTNNYFDDLILLKMKNEKFSEDGFNILQRSFKQGNMTLKYTFETDWKCSLSVNNEVVANGIATTKQKSRQIACKKLLQELRKKCYTLVEKTRYVSDGSTVEKNATETQKDETKIMDDNIGKEMLKRMGWKGGGLGKTEQGRSEPVMVQDHVRRSGLGTNLTGPQMIKKITSRLKDFAHSDSDYDLVFSNDFTKDERAKMHAIAQKFHLKTRSYGTGEARHLVVSKAANSKAILNKVINQGGENERFVVIPPSGISSP